MRFSRRAFVGGALTFPLTSLKLQPFGLPVARAADPVWRHGVSLFGDVKYPPEFPHFDYVNSRAPKGGSVRQIALGTFDIST